MDPSASREGLAPPKPYASQSLIAEHYRVERFSVAVGWRRFISAPICEPMKEVAVKVLHPELGSAVVVSNDFLREISFASELDHPQIPKFLHPA
jgi:serine/threonine protein kinase